MIEGMHGPAKPLILVVEDNAALATMLRYNLAICRQLRRRPATRTLPIIMVTAGTEGADPVRGLDVGADDYVTKPFRMETLLARMRALLRRSSTVPEHKELRFHDLTLDQAAHRVQHNGRAIHLGPTEYRLLEFLMRSPRRVFSLVDVLNAVLGHDIHVELRTVDMHIRRLRKAINGPGELDVIRTVRAAGYAMDTEAVQGRGPRNASARLLGR